MLIDFLHHIYPDQPTTDDPPDGAQSLYNEEMMSHDLMVYQNLSSHLLMVIRHLTDEHLGPVVKVLSHVAINAIPEIHAVLSDNPHRVIDLCGYKLIFTNEETALLLLLTFPSLKVLK